MPVSLALSDRERMEVTASYKQTRLSHWHVRLHELSTTPAPRKELSPLDIVNILFVQRSFLYEENIMVFKPTAYFKVKIWVEEKQASQQYLEELMPVRDGMKNSGIDSYAVPSRKMERMVHCEGPNERDYAYLLEYDPLVVSYEEQPCKIAYIFERKRRSYIPDFAVHWRHQQPSLVECKPASKLGDPENLRKWTAARMWCEQEHYTFTVVTDVELRECGTLLSNVKLLAGHAHQRITPQAKDYLLKIVQMENGSLTMAELVERAHILKPLVVRSCVWHLLYTRELYSDLAKPLNVKTTRISLPVK